MLWREGSSPSSSTKTVWMYLSLIKISNSVKLILEVSTTTGVETKYYGVNMKKEHAMICGLVTIGI